MASMPHHLVPPPLPISRKTKGQQTGVSKKQCIQTPNTETVSPTKKQIFSMILCCSLMIFFGEASFGLGGIGEKSSCNAWPQCLITISTTTADKQNNHKDNKQKCARSSESKNAKSKKSNVRQGVPCQPELFTDQVEITATPPEHGHHRSDGITATPCAQFMRCNTNRRPSSLPDLGPEQVRLT